MDQMNVRYRSACWLRSQESEKSGRYHNASEVVREALRRMEEDTRAHCGLAKPPQKDILTDLRKRQLDGIRRRVRVQHRRRRGSKFLDYEGREGLEKLADGLKARGRQLLPGKPLASNALGVSEMLRRI